MYLTTQYQRSQPLQPMFETTIIAQDPSVHRRVIAQKTRKILTAKVRIPGEWIGPGPRSHRFHVVDYDETARAFVEPIELMKAMAKPGWPAYEDRFSDATDETLVSDPGFRAVNAFVIASRTLATFEFALGRRVPWGFGKQQLFLVPHAMVMENAYYQAGDEGIYFGYFTRDDGQVVQTCLSHDIIAHETTHAVLDGLRPRLLEPGLPDQFAFHEGLADIVALLSVFSMPEVVEEAIRGMERKRRLPKRVLSLDAFKKSMLLTLAEQWPGDPTYGRPVIGLRTSVFMEPNTKLLKDPEYEEPHLRGEILVAAVMQTLLSIWLERMARLAEGGRPSHALVAEEGAKSALHLLKMVIRAIDYMPPVELEYEDVIDGIIESDTVIAPVDDHGYRLKLEAAFASYGIYRPKKEVVDVSVAAPAYENVSFTLLRTDPEEAFRFIWNNAPLLGIDRDFDICVDRVLPCVRVGPDGVFVQETAVTYVQSLEDTARELAKVLGKPFGTSLEPPARRKFQIWGGGTLIFDQFGQVRHHQSKRLLDWDRQNRRLDYLLRTESGEEPTAQVTPGRPVGARSRRVAFHAPGAKRRPAEW